jgi:hypothetical protein
MPVLEDAPVAHPFNRNLVSNPARVWLLREALFTYLFYALLFIGLTGTQAPALPSADLDEDGRGDGLLLGLFDGYWHYVAREGTIVAVPPIKSGP